jgi:hypothetical protein
VDLARGAATTLAPAPAGIWLGAPAMRGREASIAFLGAGAAGGEFVVTLDGAGHELRRSLLSSRTPLRGGPFGADGGAPSAAALLSSATSGPSLLVDDAGTLAFGTLAGGLGVVAASAAARTELLADACAGGAAGLAGFNSPLGLLALGAPVAGLAPLGPGSFVAVCRSGAVVAVAGAAPSAPSAPNAAVGGGQGAAPHL